MSNIVVIEPFRFLPTGAIKPLDLNSNFDDADYISCAFPNFPATSIDANSSYIQITSNPNGDFEIGPSDKVYFNNSLNIYPSSTGNYEFKFLRGTLNTIDKSKVTGIRFNISAISNCNFKVAAIRLLRKTWKYSPLDIDTVNGRIERPVSLTGSPTSTSEFPVTSIDAEPSDFPILWRSDNITNIHDPQPVDIRGSVLIYTGSMTETSEDENTVNANEISLYFRERTEDFLTQLDLNSDFTQEELNNLGRQPDFGPALYQSRTQTDLDSYTQEMMNSSTQSELERLPDDAAFSWLKLSLRWDAVKSHLDFRDSEGNGYSFTEFNLEANKYYIATYKVDDTSVNYKIYASDQLGTFNRKKIIFDSGDIIDGGIAKRHKGRFGWYAKLLDGDAFIENIRMRGVSHGEYRSHPFASQTPVVGGKVTMDGTLYRDLYKGITSAPWGGSISLDTTKSTSKEAIKVQITKGKPMQGATSVPFYLDDFSETNLKFRLWYPSSSIKAGAKLEIFLLGENIRISTLKLPKFIPDQWNNISIDLESIGKNLQTGYYKIAWVQTLSTVPTTFWLDQIHINANMVSWAGRAEATDAFGIQNIKWIPMKDTVNQELDGAVFSTRGSGYQVRAQARQYDARINSIKTQPKYAELGRFIWAEDVASPSVPVSTFTKSISAKTVTTDASMSTGNISIYEWNWGDGKSSLGKQSSNTYDRAGTYTITLSTVDRSGGRSTSSQDVVIV